METKEFEYPEKMCEYCCNFDKEHIGMDGMALCKLTMTLAYAEDYGGNCMFYNVPKEQIIVPPCKVGDTVYLIKYGNVIELVVRGLLFDTKGLYSLVASRKDKYQRCTFEYNRFRGDLKYIKFTREEAEKALAERSGNG